MKRDRQETRAWLFSTPPREENLRLLCLKKQPFAVQFVNLRVRKSLFCSGAENPLSSSYVAAVLPLPSHLSRNSTFCFVSCVILPPENSFAACPRGCFRPPETVSKRALPVFSRALLPSAATRLVRCTYTCFRLVSSVQFYRRLFHSFHDSAWHPQNGRLCVFVRGICRCTDLRAVVREGRRFRPVLLDFRAFARSGRLGSAVVPADCSCRSVPIPTEAQRRR